MKTVTVKSMSELIPNQKYHIIVGIVDDRDYFNGYAYFKGMAAEAGVPYRSLIR